MATPSDELIEHLLDKIAFSRSKGFTAEDFEEAVTSFHNTQNDSDIIVDEKWIESAWDRVSGHEDVDIRADENHVQTSSDKDESHRTKLQSQLAGKRIFTSSERLWRMVAGHESQPGRIPGMEFELLVAIAQHGPQGVLQSIATRITGQDKRSIPARTDRLAQKGYITKTSVMAEKARTSILRLSKWARSDPTQVMEGAVLHYDVLFDKTIALLKENSNIMSMDVLCKELDIKKIRRKMFIRGCLRLSQAGCTRLLRCRIMDEDGNPVMYAHGRREKTTRAIQLLRDPTAEDKSVWSSFRSNWGPHQAKRKKSGRERRSSDEDVDDEESLEEEDDDDDAEDDDEDAEGETDDEVTVPPPTTTTPSRKSNRIRTPSSLAKAIDYSQLLEDEEDDEENDSEQDAEHEITESASPETRRRRKTPAPKRQPVQPRKTSNNASSTVRQVRGFPQTIDGPSGGVDSRFSVFRTTPAPATGAVVGTTISEVSADGKRLRKKSTKALEADALRAVGEPLLTEPVEEYDVMDTSDGDSGVEETLVDVDSDGIDGAELDPQTPGSATKTKHPRKKREYIRKDKSSTQKKRAPIIKKREIPPEEYEEYEKYAQVTAERLVRIEMKTGMKRSATMAGLDDDDSNDTPGASTSNKTPRINNADSAAAAEEEGDEHPTPPLPPSRVAALKAIILSRSEPGIYINPPGARNLKLENYVQRGRPRNAIIAVVKSPRLESLEWWKVDDGGPRFAPKARKRRTARIGRGLNGEERSEFFVEGSDGSEDDGEGGRRKRRRGGSVTGRSSKRGDSSGGNDLEDGEREEVGALREAKRELEELRKKKGRPNEQERIRMRVLERRIEGLEMSNEEEGDGDVFGESGGMGSMRFVRGDILAGSVDENTLTASRLEEADVGAEDDASRLSVVEDAVDRVDDVQAGGNAVDEEPEGLSDDENPTLPSAVDKADDVQAGGSAVNEESKVVTDENSLQMSAAEKTNNTPPGFLSTKDDPPATITGNPQPRSPAPPNPTTSSSRNPAQIDLDTLLAIKPKNRTPQDTHQIEALKESVGNAYINRPGSMEELEALGRKTGRGTVEGIKRRKALESQFMGGSGNSQRNDTLGIDMTTHTAVPSGLSTPQTPALPSLGNDLQTQQHDMTLSVSTPRPVLEGGGLSTFTVSAIEPQKTHPPSIENNTLQPSTFAIAKKFELVTKEYVDAHPDEHFHHRGGGRYGRGERFSRTYVDSHPEETFYLDFGEGKGARFKRAVGEEVVNGTAPVVSETLEEAEAGVSRPEVIPTTVEHQPPPQGDQQDGSGGETTKMVTSNAADELGSASTAIEQTIPAEVGGPSQQQDNLPLADSMPPESRQAESDNAPDPVESASPKPRGNQSAGPAQPDATGSTPRKPTKRKSTGTGDSEERFTKDYVLAHPEEHFYHRGGGCYLRGETFSKEYVDAHPAETFKFVAKQYIRLSAAESEAQGIATKPPTIERVVYTREHVESHPDEDFWHRGGGKWLAGLPPTGSAPLTGVRGPGAKKWKERAQRERDAMLSGSASIPQATPMSALLTIYKPYSPQVAGKVGGSSQQAVMQEAAMQDVDVEMADVAAEEENIGHPSTSSPDMDEDVEMDDGDRGNHQDEDVNAGQDDHIDGPGDGTLNQETYSPLGNEIHFPVDLTTAIIVRRTAKEKQKQAGAEAAQPARRACLQTVSKPDDGDADPTETRRAQVAKKAAQQARKPAKGPRTPARGSKASRDLRRMALQTWPFGPSSHAEVPAQALALLMHPVQDFHIPSGTFGTDVENAPLSEQKEGRALRDRGSLAKLPQILEDDFCETPGLVVKLKIKNLASVLPPNTAFESGLFATSPATDAVPLSKLTGKPRRPYNRRSKKVTFQVDDSDGDEFRDDGEMEDEDDLSEDLDASAEDDNDDQDDTAVARPERRKRSRGVNGELRHRDMASGPAFKDADRLVIAFALVAAICGGLRVEGINWTLIAHALGFRYEGGFLRRRWDHYKRTRKSDVDALRLAIHEPFLAAYEDDDFPRVDFQNLNNTDWPALFEWVQTTVVPNVQLQPKTEGPKVPDLLQTREETEAQFEIKEPADLYDVRLDEYFVSTTEQSRRNLISKYTYGSALPGELRPKDQVDQDMALLRSWVRAVAVTKQYNYHPEAAAKKLRKFSPEMLQQVTAELIENRTFSQERKNRMLPGRNYQISNECLQSFKRWPPRPDESRFLRFVAQAWKNINTHFQSHDQLALVPSASDPEYLVLTNMVAQGMIQISTTYPKIKNEYDAPFPKLSPWGYCGPTYETKKVDMSRLKFPIRYTKTDKYKPFHELLQHVPIPLHPAEVVGEVGQRIPFWVDIHGNLIDDVWDMVLRSVLHLLVFRAGITVQGIEMAHGRKLWAWEVERVLGWMEEVGIAVQEERGGGWRAGEWWYCAFSPEVARWKAPVVVES